MAPFVGEERREIAELLAERYDQVLADSTPRLTCLVAEGGWGKTRIVQEFYGWLQRDRQPQGEYWPPKFSDPEQDPMRSRKIIYPERVIAPADQAMPWLWWGLRCEQTSSGRKMRALLNDGVQLKAHLGALIEVAERREDNRDLALSILGETLAFLPGVGQIASIAMAAQSLAPRAWKKVVDAFKASQNRRSEQEPRTVDLAASSAPEVSTLVELVKQFVSADLPLVLAVDDAHAADPDTVEFVRRILTLKAPVLVVCTAWPSTLDDQLDEERDIEPAKRETFGGLLAALREERPDNVTRQDLSPLPDDALAELVTALAPRTDEESLQALLETSGGNPLVLRLNLTSPRIQRSIVDGAITLSPEELRKLPRGFGRIISERFEDLADPDQMWLAEAALQGFEFLPGYIGTSPEELDLERIGAFVRKQGDGNSALGRFIEPAVHRAILEEAEELMSDSERDGWARTTLEALQQEPMGAPDEEAGGRIWCSLLVRLAEGMDPQLLDEELVSHAAYQLSFIERDLGLHGAELAAAEASVRWAEREPDGSVRALRVARWAGALLANNEPEEAVRKAQEALTLIESDKDHTSDDMVTVMYVLAKSHLQDQDPEAAREVGQRAYDVAADSADRIVALEVVAEAQRVLGELDGSREALTKALEIAREVKPPSPETVLTLEMELLEIEPYLGSTELWEEQLERVKAELGTDHFLYTFCLMQVIEQHLLNGDLQTARPMLAELEGSPGYEPNTLIEALTDVLEGGNLSRFQEAIRDLVEAPYNSREQTAMFAQIGAAIGVAPFGGEQLDGPLDFLRQAQLDLATALEWLLVQFREHRDEWSKEQWLFAVQAGTVYLGEHLLGTGSPSSVSGELLAEIQEALKSHPQPALAGDLVRCYSDAVAILEGKEVGPVDESMPPLIQVRALVLRAVAASAAGDSGEAERSLEDAYARACELATWPSLKLVLMAGERWASPLCAKGWEVVSRLEFGAEAERWEADAGFAVWLYRKQRYGEAEALERRVLEEKARVNGPRDPSTITAKANLAATLSSSGKTAEARDLYRELLGDREELLGEQNPLVADTKRKLAQEMIALREYEAARPIQEAASDGDPTINDRERMAIILENVGEPEAARPLREAILEWWTERYGEDDDRTLESLAESVGNLRMGKQPEEAYLSCRRLLEGRMRTGGEDAAATHDAKHLLASICLELDKAEEAVLLAQEIVDSRARTLGPTHPLTLEAKTFLGVARYKQGDFRAAFEVEREVLEARQHNVAEARVRAAIAAASLAQTLAKIDGKLGEACEMVSTAVGELRLYLGEDHSETARYVSVLVELRVKAGEIGPAREVATESLVALREKHGADHPATAMAAERLDSIEDSDSLAAADG